MFFLPSQLNISEMIPFFFISFFSGEYLCFDFRCCCCRWWSSSIYVCWCTNSKCKFRKLVMMMTYNPFDSVFTPIDNRIIVWKTNRRWDLFMCLWWKILPPDSVEKKIAMSFFLQLSIPFFLLLLLLFSVPNKLVDFFSPFLSLSL